MSALTDLFTALANKIRSKTGTQTTYTPSEMVSDGIDDVYDAGVAAGGTSTPITPSNSSPASMTSGTKYTPSTNGYAIASYDSVTPSSTPESVASGDIVKIGGSGVIVDAIPTPTSITPSNSSPVALTADTPVNPTSGGYAIASYDNVTPSSTAVSVAADDIVKIGGAGVIVDTIPTPTNLTPSNSTPAQITSGNDYHATGNGYAIESYDSVTPSSTPESVSSGDIVKIGGSGVIVDSVPPTPTSITPSNATPVALTANTPVTPTASGYAIASYDTRSPSNLNPGPLTSGEIYKVSNSGYAIATYSDVTPSNSSPVSLTSGEINKMGGNGYAIASYTSVTPSSTPASVSTGDIVKMGGNGVVIDAVPTPTSITPSNISPPFLATGEAVSPTRNGYAVQSIEPLTPSNSNPVPIEYLYGNIYQSAGNGYAIESYNSITPSNSSPVSLSSGSFYKPSASGYAISSYSSKTPSDTSPASVSSGAIIKASSSGYLYKTGLPILGQQPDAEFSNNTAGTSGSVNITVTQKPRYIIMSISSRTSAYLHQLGVIDVTAGKAWRMGCNADGTYSENWSNYTTYFTTISASTVTFSYAAANYNKRVVIQIYY